MSKIVIFANGISSDPLLNLQYIDNDDIIICADGGAWYAMEMNLVPNLLIGDFDSLDKVIIEHLRSKGTAIEKYPAKKDKTDLELALEAATRYAFKKVLILTAFGGRIDQLFANIMLLTSKAWPFETISLADGNQRTWLLDGPDSMQIHGTPGDTFSIVPISKEITGLNISGVEWPLKDKTVIRGSTLTLSNVFFENSIDLSVKKGIALAVHIKKAR